eukprot:g1536.t1
MSCVEDILTGSLTHTLKVCLGHSVKLRHVALTKTVVKFPGRDPSYTDKDEPHLRRRTTGTTRDKDDQASSSVQDEEGEDTSSSSRRVYLCMGEHAFYLVSQDMSTVLIKGGISYDLLDKIVWDGARENLFEIQLKSPGVTDLAGKRYQHIPIATYDRQSIMNRLQLYWRTHYMFTTWKVPDMATQCKVDRGKVSTKGSDEGDEDAEEFFSRAFKDCPDGEVEYDLKNYRFWVDESFAAGSKPGQYRSRKKYGRMVVQVKPVKSVVDLRRSKYSLIKAVADAEVTRIADLVKEYVHVSQPHFYRKKYNLTHDQAKWTAWVSHIRTGAKLEQLDPRVNKAATIAQMRDIVVVAARRQYIPPLMAGYQDFVFTMYAKSWKQLKKKADIEKRGEHVFRVCTGVYDSLRTKSLQDFEYDYNVLQTKADTLWLDEDAARHFQSTLLLMPSGYYRARRFVLSVLRILYTLLEQPRYSLEDGEKVGTDDDPFYHVDELMKRTQGLSEKSKRLHYDRWRVRVWRYLAFCIDGNLRELSNATMSIEDIASKTISAGVEHTSEQRKLSTILNHLLHFRLKGSPYLGDSVVDAFDRAGLMDEFEFNERVFVKLLKANYFVRFVFANAGRSASPSAVSRGGSKTAETSAASAIVSGESGSSLYATSGGAESKYPSFLVRILRQCTETPARMAVTKELQAGICQQLLKLSTIYKDLSVGGRGRSSVRAADEVAVLVVLPEIVKLLRKHDDEVIKTHLMATLVNFTFGNEQKKKEVMRHDMPAIANQCLMSQSPDLVRQSCMLLANLTTTKSGCKAVAMVNDNRSRSGGGVMFNLAMLLQKRSFPPYNRSVVVRYQAMRVLQNLSKDQTLHSAMVDCLPRTVRGSGGKVGSVFLLLLADILTVRESRSGTDNRRVKSLLMCTCTCFTRLCYKHNDRKKIVGRMAIDSLVALLGDDISKRNPDLTIKILMLCCSLAFDPYKENLSRFKKASLNKVLNEVKMNGAMSKHSMKYQELIEKLIMDIHKAQKKSA